jgi:hypothetical protein
MMNACIAGHSLGIVGNKGKVASADYIEIESISSLPS